MLVFVIFRTWLSFLSHPMSVSSVFLSQMPFPSDLLLLALSSLSFPPSTLTCWSSLTLFFLFPWVIPPCFYSVWYSGMMSCSILDFVLPLHFLYFCTHCLFDSKVCDHLDSLWGTFQEQPSFLMLLLLLCPSISIFEVNIRSWHKDMLTLISPKHNFL